MDDYTATANFKQQSFDELPDEEKEKIITYLRNALSKAKMEEISILITLMKEKYCLKENPTLLLQK